MAHEGAASIESSDVTVLPSATLCAPERHDELGQREDPIVGPLPKPGGGHANIAGRALPSAAIGTLLSPGCAKSAVVMVGQHAWLD